MNAASSNVSKSLKNSIERDTIHLIPCVCDLPGSLDAPEEAAPRFSTQLSIVVVQPVE